MCQGKKSCSISPSKPTFRNICKNVYKYLHLKYHCEKDKEIKKPKFAIVMFVDKIKPNTIYEHSASEFYQYSDIHGYKFVLHRERYDTLRDIYYSKLHFLIEAIMEGLKTNEYDWVFWVDSDTLLGNPNIKLETFLPLNNKVHFISSADINDLNAGVFLIKVHPWSLNFLMRAVSYQYFYPEEELLYADQTSMRNVLVRGNEDEHYVVVPPRWFNNIKLPGYFLYRQ